MILSFAAAAFAAVPRLANAQTVWHMMTEYPATTVSGAGLSALAELVLDQTKGVVRIETAFDNRPGIERGGMLSAAMNGQITGGDAFAGALDASDPVFGLASLPFLVQSIEAAQRLNERAQGLYAAALAARHFKLLYVTIWPPTGLWSDRPVATPEDLAALKMRTYDPASAAVMQAAGAVAEFLSVNEAIQRVKDHRLNGVLSSGDGGAGRQLGTYLHYFTPINYAVPVSIAFIRQDAFDALPAAVQVQIDCAAEETGRRQIASLARRLAQNDAQMKANGVTIADPVPPALLARLKIAAQGPIAAWKAKAGPDARALLETME